VSKRIYLDIETLPPLESERDRVRERIAKKLRDTGEQITEAEFERRTEHEFRRLAMDAAWGRLLCIGVLVESPNGREQRRLIGLEPCDKRFHLDERRTLERFWQLLGDEVNIHHDTFIGFNLIDFDLLFLVGRSSLVGIKPPFNISFRRYRQQPVYDIMWEFTRWHHRISMDDMAHAFGVESSKRDGLDGSRVYDFFLADRHQEIGDYCARDVLLTRTLYRRMNFITDCDSQHAA